MLPKAKIPELISLLKSKYGKAQVALTHKDPFELLVATILSAQCTDKRVNMVTPTLFARFPNAAALAKAKQEEVEEIIRSTGFFHSKAKNIIAMSQALVAKHGGKVPRTMEELIELPGVARKTANVVLGSGYGITSGIVVDTHVIRLSHLLGLTESDDPVQIERELMGLVPKSDWILFGHMLIHHGREICVARRPKCEECLLNQLCPSAFVVNAPEGAKKKAGRPTSKAAKAKEARAGLRAAAKKIRSSAPGRRRGKS